MPWGVAIGAVVSGVAAYAGQSAQEDAQEDAQKREIEAQKQLVEMKRQYQLEDRKANQDAVGAWSKYLDPSLVGPDVGKGTTASAAATNSSSDKPITDPNDPHFAPNALAPASNAIPLKARHPAFTVAPDSLWFARQYPDYNPNDPTNIPAHR